MAYATFDFYTNTFYGTSIAEADFPRLAERATEYLDSITFNRTKTFDEVGNVLARACCAVAETVQLNEQGGGIVSETIGKMTRNYANGVSNTPTDGQRLYETAKRYLALTGLLYGGGSAW